MPQTTGLSTTTNRSAKALGADLASRLGGFWASFGYIAAEADLARMGVPPH